MLQNYLNEQLIQTTEDGNFDKLKKASLDIVKKISKDKDKIISYTLASLDPEISPNNKSILEAKEIIIENWNTFLANSKDTPLTYIRAVILEALEILANDSNSLASLTIWFASRNIIKYYKLGREKKILTEFITSIGNKIEEETSESWSFPPEEEIEMPDIISNIIDKTEFETVLKAATIYKEYGDGGENTSSTINDDSNWGKFFSTKAGKGLTDIINKSLKKQLLEIKKSQSDYIYEIRLMQIRTQLLWWKESFYSPSTKKSYNELKDGRLNLIIANDYSKFIPIKYPSSVDFFLREVLNSISSSMKKNIKISDFLKSIEQNKSSLVSILEEHSEDEVRILLVNFIKGLIHGKYQTKQFKSLVGIPESTELPYTEFTVWLFHDFQTLKILTNK